ncbi:MAG TPA: phenylacetate--CoA ligase [Deferrisomatales bacterium]|nr:phenylacetate--CoA ligase [Deferrisomatales bacterium]
MSGLEAVERMSRDEMTALQTERLRNTVVQVFERIPFYRQSLAGAGLQPGDVRGLEDVSRLPFTVKKDLSDHYPRGLLAVDPQKTVRVHSSSGSTGKPINVFHTRTDLQNWTARVARSLRIAGVTADDVCQIAFRYTLFTGAFGHHWGAEEIGATVIPISSGQTERQLQLMQDLQTTVLHCTPSYAVILAETIERLGISTDALSLRLGIHGAEPMSDELRDELQARLGLRVARDYGLTELDGPGVSIECPARCGYHINEDFYYPEIVDPDSGKSLPDGELGELVFTSLHKEASPLLRYRTRDITHLDRTPCACGRTLARHGLIRGRTDDMLILGGVNFFPSQVESLLLSFPEVAPHYCIHLQREGRRDRVRVAVEAAPGFWGGSVPETRAEVQAKLEARARSDLGFRVGIDLLAPATLERSEGKSKRVRDLRPQC